MGFLYDFVLKNFWYKEDCSWRALVFVDADPQDVILDERFLSVFHEASVGLGIFEWFLIGLWVAQVLDEVPDVFAQGVLFLQFWQLVVKYIDCFAHITT